jgi:hypothetical protein
MQSEVKPNITDLLCSTRDRRKIETPNDLNEPIIEQIVSKAEEKKVDKEVVEKVILNVNKFKRYYESLSPVNFLNVYEYELFHSQSSDSHYSAAKEHEIASHLIFLEQAVDTIKIYNIFDKYTIEAASKKINSKRKKISLLLAKLKQQENDLTLKNTRYKINNSIYKNLQKIYSAAQNISQKLEGSTEQLSFSLVINVMTIMLLVGVFSGSIVLDYYCFEPSSQMPGSTAAKLSLGVGSVILGCAALIGVIYLLKNIKNNFKRQGINEAGASFTNQRSK